MDKKIKNILSRCHLNSQFKTYDYWLRVLAWCLGITVCSLLIIAILPDVLGSKHFIKVWAPKFNYVVNLLNEHDKLNDFVVITYIVLAILGVRRAWINQYLSVINILFCLAIIKILSLSYWVYPNLPCVKHLTYLTLYNVTLITFIVVEVKKVVIYDKPDLDHKYKGFSNDVSEIPESYRVRDDYADEIASMLNKTDLTESFAIAITGRWGSGKTTFINDMIPKIKERMQTIIFNPWNSSSPNEIITDFFNLLRNAVIPNFSTLKHPLRKYSKLLTVVDMPKTANNILTSISADDDIGQVKREIEDGLRHFKRPIAIFIDDVDRLSINEIREVLKLIRNTAKFPNILYIVTMDKDYVTQQLGLLGINGDLYLEKIFQLEISLPKMDDTEVLMTMRSELLAMTMSHKSVNGLFDNLLQETKGVILSVIPTFRSAKRFARQFSTIFNFIGDTIGLKEIDLYDLFYLELIHYYDRETYFILANDIGKYLKIKIDRLHDVLAYRLKDGVIESIDRIKGPLIKDKNTRYFIDRIFANKEFNRNSLQIVENYFKYFGFNTPLNRITDEEFKKFLGEADFHKQETINGWCFSVKRPILPQSIFSHFISYKVDNQTIERDIAYYFNGAFIWLTTEYRNIQELYYLLPMILVKDRYPEKFRSKALEYLKSDLRDFVNSDNYLTVVKVLFHLIWTDATTTPYLFDNGLIFKALHDSITRLLKKRHYDNVLLVMEDGNIINEIAEYFVANSDSEKGTTDALGILIDLLAHNEPKSQNKERVEEKFKHVLKNEENYKEEYDSFSRIFGGKGMSLLQRYLDECFVIPEATTDNQEKQIKHDD